MCLFLTSCAGLEQVRFVLISVSVFFMNSLFVQVETDGVLIYYFVALKKQAEFLKHLFQQWQY